MNHSSKNVISKVFDSRLPAIFATSSMNDERQKTLDSRCIVYLIRHGETVDNVAGL